MKLRLGTVALLVVLSACGSSAASSVTGSSSRHCGPAGATTIAAGSQARAYSWHGAVYGCSFARGRSYRLGSTARLIRESRVAPVAVAGSVAAYGLTSFGVDTANASLEVRRLTDGRLLGEFAVTRTGVVEGVESVQSLAVKSDGAVAWIGVAHSIIGRGTVIEVHAADASASADRLLDSGPEIAPQSLRLHGSTITWKHGAATRQATLR